MEAKKVKMTKQHYAGKIQPSICWALYSQAVLEVISYMTAYYKNVLKS